MDYQQIKREAQLTADREMMRVVREEFPQVIETLVMVTDTIKTHENALHHIDRDRHLNIMRGCYSGIIQATEAGDPYKAKALVIRWVNILGLWSEVVGTTLRVYWYDKTDHKTGVYSFTAVGIILGVIPTRSIANTRLDKRWLKSQIDNGVSPAAMGYNANRNPVGLTPTGHKRIRRR